MDITFSRAAARFAALLLAEGAGIVDCAGEVNQARRMGYPLLTRKGRHPFETNLGRRVDATVRLGL
jgi:hypothetical protein